MGRNEFSNSFCSLGREVGNGGRGMSPLLELESPLDCEARLGGGGGTA